MNRKIITVKPGGQVVFISDPRLRGLWEHGEVQHRRASHVEPVNLFLRVLFHLIRRLFGETGRMARFTRTWPCRWRINMAPVHGPVLGPYRDRAKAIDAEVEWLHINYLTSKG